MATAIPLIAAVIAAGTSVYTQEKSLAAQDKATRDAAALAKQQTADAATAAKEADERAQMDANKPKTAQNFPDVAAQIKAKFAADQQAGGGLSTGFYSDQLAQQYPGFEGVIKEIVSGSPTNAAPPPQTGGF